jgi:hypothetical protein
MATTTSREEATYDSPSTFFEAMDYTDHASMGTELPSYDFTDNFTNPFKPYFEADGGMDSPLSENKLNILSIPDNLWNDPSQPEALQPIDSIISPIFGYQSRDTGYISQGESSEKLTPTDQTNSCHTLARQSSTTRRARMRSSTKCTTAKSADSVRSAETKPVRKARRTPKLCLTSAFIDDEGKDAKHEHFLARNREAATKCRQKKKEWTQDLEQKARDLSSQKEMLITYLAMLKNQLLTMKFKYLEQADCGCNGSRDFLKNTVSTMPPANPALYSKLESKMIESGLAAEIARKQSSASCFDIGALLT